MSTSRITERGSFNLNVRLHKFGSRFFGNFPNMNKPQPIGFYSVNAAREFVDDASSVSYLRLPPKSALPLDLNAGMDKVQRKTSESDFHDIHLLCEYIAKHPELLTTEVDGRLKLSSDFVTFRGILRQIMCRPYQWDDYRLMATCLNGTIYISKLETEKHRLEKKQMSARSKSMCSWGFKFEQYCTTPDPNIEPETSSPVQEGVEFACIFQTQLNELRLLYGAEMDCLNCTQLVDLNAPRQLQSVEFLELKTSAWNMNSKQKRSFDLYKSQIWWSQSFLVNIKTIWAGLRDENGVLQDIKKYDVGELHRNKPWNAAAMTTFLVNFLRAVKSIMKRIDEQTAVQIDFIANQSEVRYTVLEGAQAVLPDWYCALMLGSAKLETDE